MTKIDELMALAWAMRGAQGASALTASASDLKKALEAALKPGGDMCERICQAIEAADAKSMREADYMLDSDDCIRIVKEFFAAVPPAQSQVNRATELIERFDAPSLPEHSGCVPTEPPWKD